MGRAATATGRAKAGRRQVKLQAAVGMREDEAERRAEAEHREDVARIAAAGAAGVHAAERRLAASLVWDATLEALLSAGVARPCLGRAGAIFTASHPNLRAGPDRLVRDEDGRLLVELISAWIASPGAQAWIAGETV